MKKEIIVVKKKKKDFKCPICGIMVDVNAGKPWVIETEKFIIKTWNYGHTHMDVFRLDGNKKIRIGGDIV